jgi:two-component system KDP operon response regulator KdpE
MKILIIGEAETIISDITLCMNMRYPDITVLSDDASKGINTIELESPDIVITDFPLSNIKPSEYICTIREFSDVPLIVLGEEIVDIDKARILETGADEYINKPLNHIEFLAITNALLRRTKGLGYESQMVVSLEEELSINLNTHEIIRSGNRIPLTPVEFKLLSALVRNRGQVLSHNSLLEKAWGTNYVHDSQLLKNEVYRLRRKLEPEPSNPRYIINERGFGYRFAKTISVKP